MQSSVQQDMLVYLLLNVTVEKVIWEANMLDRGIIFHKLVQILVYANYIDIIAWSLQTINEAFLALEQASRHKSEY